MPGMHRRPKFLALSELDVGMHVVVENRYSSERMNGLVLNVATHTRLRMIDDKPVGKEKRTQVIIAWDNGGEDLVINNDNFNRYQITKL